MGNFENNFVLSDTATETGSSSQHDAVENTDTDRDTRITGEIIDGVSKDDLNDLDNSVGDDDIVGTEHQLPDAEITTWDFQTEGGQSVEVLVINGVELRINELILYSQENTLQYVEDPFVAYQFINMPMDVSNMEETMTEFVIVPMPETDEFGVPLNQEVLVVVPSSCVFAYEIVSSNENHQSAIAVEAREMFPASNEMETCNRISNIIPRSVSLEKAERETSSGICNILPGSVSLEKAEMETSTNTGNIHVPIPKDETEIGKSALNKDKQMTRESLPRKTKEVIQKKVVDKQGLEPSKRSIKSKTTPNKRSMKSKTTPSKQSTKFKTAPSNRRKKYNTKPHNPKRDGYDLVRMNDSSSNLKYKCQLCPYENFKSKKRMLNHLKLHKPGSDGMKCHNCSMMISSEKMEKHLRCKHKIF
ncbi:unnamed protein product [Orchesella dallaii]|uniref:C2H2-type domain-containing protein n=1 Tax=Orchesella dallaii TaxID=48710 RepID=A0ABP1PZM3_9HEXA